MAPKSKFLLKDSPPEIIEAATARPKGRSYDPEYGKKAGGIRVDDLVLGMKLASVAITDDKPNTLKKVSKANPWQKEALKIITGSKQDAYKPLSSILRDHFGLTLDCHIDVSGIDRGRPLDTQGYIAHNDELIVLSYRCTTSALDWITNLSTTSSEWEPDIDIALGHAGYCSCLMGYDLPHFCGGISKENGDNIKKPRVHTGFYNNFLHTTPMILEHIVPLLKEDQKPRKLMVVGHSLGAGIATLAACYFILNFEWELLPHQLVCVTAGAPRSVKQNMADIVHERLATLRPMDKAFFCRVVLNEDVVTKVPPRFLGYVHLDNLVYITEEGEVLIKPDQKITVKGVADIEDGDDDEDKEVENICKNDPYADLRKSTDEEKKDDDDDTSQQSSLNNPNNEKYEKMIKMVPRPLKDHMPDFYLKPLINLFEREKSGSSITTSSH